MPRIVRGGLIQATLCEPTTSPVEKIKQAMIDKHVALISQAANKGVQVACLQELFYGPYSCTPRGQIVAEACRDRDEIVVADLGLDLIREVRHVWQFFRDRSPETYSSIRRLDVNAQAK